MKDIVGLISRQQDMFSEFHKEFTRQIEMLMAESGHVNDWAALTQPEVKVEEYEEEDSSEEYACDDEKKHLGMLGFSWDAPEAFPASYGFTESMIDLDSMAGGVRMGIPYDVWVHGTSQPTTLLPIIGGMFRGE